MKNLWAETVLITAIEGVIREASKGNALEVQRWYFNLKKEAYKQSIKDGLSAREIEEKALMSMKLERANLYREIIKRLSSKGGVLEEVNDWLKTHKPL